MAAMFYAPSLRFLPLFIEICEEVTTVAKFFPTLPASGQTGCPTSGLLEGGVADSQENQQEEPHGGGDWIVFQFSNS